MAATQPTEVMEPSFETGFSQRLMMIFCKFDNGKKTGLDAGSDEEVIGYVRGLATAVTALGCKVWVTGSMDNEAGIDDDGWLSPETWLNVNT